jgi:hypothetical protein
MPNTQPTLIPLPDPWTNDDTQAYLNANPLPPAFRWKHRDGGDAIVAPKHATLSGGYGKWLRETPYFQGLFEAIHAILLASGDHLPDVDTLAKKLTAQRAAHTAIRSARK